MTSLIVGAVCFFFGCFIGITGSYEFYEREQQNSCKHSYSPIHIHTEEGLFPKTTVILRCSKCGKLKKGFII